MRHKRDPALRPPFPDWVLDAEATPPVHVDGAPERVMTHPGRDGWRDALEWVDAHGYSIFDLADARTRWRAEQTP